VTTSDARCTGGIKSGIALAKPPFKNNNNNDDDDDDDNNNNNLFSRKLDNNLRKNLVHLELVALNGVET
jgi:hypothetical protein